MLTAGNIRNSFKDDKELMYIRVLTSLDFNSFGGSTFSIVSGSENFFNTAACILPGTGAGITNFPTSSVDSCSFGNVPFNLITMARLSKLLLLLPRNCDIILLPTIDVITKIIVFHAELPGITDINNKKDVGGPCSMEQISCFTIPTQRNPWNRNVTIVTICNCNMITT